MTKTKKQQKAAASKDEQRKKAAGAALVLTAGVVASAPLWLHSGGDTCPFDTAADGVPPSGCAVAFAGPPATLVRWTASYGLSREIDRRWPIQDAKCNELGVPNKVLHAADWIEWTSVYDDAERDPYVFRVKTACGRWRENRKQ